MVLTPRNPQKRLILFLDEVNLPKPDAYGTQRAAALTRQLVEQRGFWRLNPDGTDCFISLQRIQLAFACNPPTDAGRVPLPPRFLRHAPLLFVDSPTVDSLKQIYGAFARGLLRPIKSLRPCASALVGAMIEVYETSRMELNAEKQAHYVYSPRELSRWVRALYAALQHGEGDTSSGEIGAGRDDSGVSQTLLVRLWAYEGIRLFHDRLVAPDERAWTLSLIASAAERHFPGVGTAATAQPMLFTSWLNGDLREVEPAALSELLRQRARAFEQEELGAPLIVFDEATEHTLRIARVLRQPVGHMLLIGASGVGKTVLTRFAAWMEGFAVHQINASRAYTAQRFHEDLRALLRRTGVHGERVCFIFDEANALDASFLESMNALLASGEVPGLFEGEEHVLLMQQCREAAQRNGVAGEQTEQDLWRTFTQHVQRNLHVIFTMNPSGADWQGRSATSPALFNRCVINWFGQWAQGALLQVAAELTKPLELSMLVGGGAAKDDAKAAAGEEAREAEIRRKLVSCLVAVYEVAAGEEAGGEQVGRALGGRRQARNHLTSRHFLDCISQCVAIHAAKRKGLSEDAQHLERGLSRIEQT